VPNRVRRGLVLSQAEQAGVTELAARAARAAHSTLRQ